MNARRTGEFDINTVPEELGAAVRFCADNEVAGDELEIAGPDHSVVGRVGPPRVAVLLSRARAPERIEAEDKELALNRTPVGGSNRSATSSALSPTRSTKRART